MKGYMGQILRVNLSDGTASTEPLDNKMIHDFVGGRGFGVKLLYDNLKPGTNPLSPENIMIFLNGPLAGTPAQSCCRWMAVSKSPQTGGYFRSVAGGAFGAELKSAGYDALIVEGRAPVPSYLWINDSRVEIRSAEKIHGKLCGETTGIIRKELGDDKINTVNVGPAAEKMIRFSGLYNDGRMAARGGMGMVMWSKNLKAIAVRGSKKVQSADRDRLIEISKMQGRMIKENPRYQYFSRMGTSNGIDGCHPLGILPIKNFQDGVLEGVESLMSDKMEKLIVRDSLCHRCHIQCGRILAVNHGPYAVGEVRGPEYEALFSFGGILGNTNLEMVIAANALCDEHGVDSISAGATIAFAMELYEKGIMSRKDLDGIDLTWGNHEAIYKLLKKILDREGAGDLLAEGSAAAAKKIGRGSERFAMHVKGLELAGYEPRAIKASGLNLATISLGANHTTGQSPEEFAPPGTPGAVDRFSKEGKGPICKRNQEDRTIVETGISCIFPRAMNILTLPVYGEMLAAATGIGMFSDTTYLSMVADRILNLERAFNVRAVFGRKNDYLPARFLEESPARGLASGQVYEMDHMLDDYYNAQGWDRATGYPTKHGMEHLGLDEAAKELDAMGRLA